MFKRKHYLCCLKQYQITGNSDEKKVPAGGESSHYDRAAYLIGRTFVNDSINKQHLSCSRLSRLAHEHNHGAGSSTDERHRAQHAEDGVLLACAFCV